MRKYLTKDSDAMLAFRDRASARLTGSTSSLAKASSTICVRRSGPTTAVIVQKTDFVQRHLHAPPAHCDGTGNVGRNLRARLPEALGIAGLDIDGDVLGTSRAVLRGLAPVQHPFAFFAEWQAPFSVARQPQPYHPRAAPVRKCRRDCQAHRTRHWRAVRE